MATQHTKETIFDFVTAILQLEGSVAVEDVTRAFYLQCLSEILRGSELFDTSWDNTVSGDLSFNNVNYIDLPFDCATVTRVEWDGDDSPLDILTEEEMEYEYPGWRSETGEPSAVWISGRRMWFSTTPTETTTGKLVVRGFGFADGNDVLEMLPADVQIAPAYYILKEYPVDPQQQRQVNRVLQYTEKWNEIDKKLKDGIAARKFRRFSYE